MRNIIYFILLFFIAQASASAQWILQTSGTVETIRDIEFINQNTGFFCGDGIIGKTTNGGVNWILLSHPSSDKPLFSINPINENLVYCIGWFETILKSTNGGSTWIEIRNGPWGDGSSYFASYFINSQTGWIAGSGQKVLKTTNGGMTIDSIYAFIGNIRDIYFKDELNGILCGEGGSVYKTTSGGLNWYKPNIQLHGNLYNFRQLSVVNNNVWIIGNTNPVYRSTDFGQNWDSIGFVTASGQTNEVNFVNSLTGFCGGTLGKQFKSTNAGFTWTQENTVFFDGFYSNSFFLNDTVGWICGNGGRIQFTNSGGETLTNISNLSNEIPRDFDLKQNYPNPFNSQTTIEFTLLKSGSIKLTVYNILGEKVSGLKLGFSRPGNYKLKYDAGNLPTGVYFYKLYSNDNYLIKKFTLIK